MSKTQQHSNFILGIIAYLFIKLPESENARKENIWYD